MKKKNIFLILLTVLLIGTIATRTSYGRTPSAEKTPDMKQLNKIIKKLVKYPDFTLNDKEEFKEVSVTFMLNDDGKIKVEKITAPSARLEEYVKDKLTDVTANDIIHHKGQMYNVKIRFVYN